MFPCRTGGIRIESREIYILLRDTELAYRRYEKSLSLKKKYDNFFFSIGQKKKKRRERGREIPNMN